MRNMVELMRPSHWTKNIFVFAALVFGRRLFGPADEVRKQAAERVEIFSAKGGFVFGAIHNIQCNTPTENVLAMFRALGRDV